MKAIASKITYKDTGYFSEIICDYLDGKETLLEFIGQKPDMGGLKKAVDARKTFSTETRKLLHTHLENQYQGLAVSEKLKFNLDALLLNNCYTVCTAHQPSLFTGTLYFVYKILHAIKLAETLKAEMPDNHFVPVFWMGSEDADLDELGMCYLRNEKLVWNTNQKGAVGRMKPTGLDVLIKKIEQQLAVLPHGKSLVSLLEKCFLNSSDIQTGTFHFIHELFNQHGLIVIVPDQAELKKIMVPIFKSDLFENIPFQQVSSSIISLKNKYKVQASPRPINLFYLKDQLRERIEAVSEGFRVVNTDILFSKQELENELMDYPERFSPNVFLRSLFQEILLPNLAYIGGGGELAYWLELKKMFDNFKVPYPVLVLRNSFLLIESKTARRIEKLPVGINDFFKGKQQLLELLLQQNKTQLHEFSSEYKQLEAIYDAVANKIASADSTLKTHTLSLKKLSLKKMEELSKKVKRKQKQHLELENKWVDEISKELFPGNSLQERNESILYYYARYGTGLLEVLYNHSLALDPMFTSLQLEE